MYIAYGFWFWHLEVTGYDIHLDYVHTYDGREAWSADVVLLSLWMRVATVQQL